MDLGEIGFSKKSAIIAGMYSSYFVGSKCLSLCWTLAVMVEEEKNFGLEGRVEVQELKEEQKKKKKKKEKGKKRKRECERGVEVKELKKQKQKQKKKKKKKKKKENKRKRECERGEENVDVEDGFGDLVRDQGEMVRVQKPVETVVEKPEVVAFFSSSGSSSDADSKDVQRPQTMVHRRSQQTRNRPQIVGEKGNNSSLGFPRAISVPLREITVSMQMMRQSMKDLVAGVDARERKIQRRERKIQRLHAKNRELEKEISLLKTSESQGKASGIIQTCHQCKQDVMSDHLLNRHQGDIQKCRCCTYHSGVFYAVEEEEFRKLGSDSDTFGMWDCCEKEDRFAAGCQRGAHEF